MRTFFLAVMIIYAPIPLISKAKVQILSDICSFIWSSKPFWKLFLKAPRVSNGNITVINHDSEAQRQLGQWGGMKAFKRLDQIVATMAVCLPAARKYLCRNIFLNWRITGFYPSVQNLKPHLRHFRKIELNTKTASVCLCWKHHKAVLDERSKDKDYAHRNWLIG